MAHGGGGRMGGGGGGGMGRGRMGGGGGGFRHGGGGGFRHGGGFRRGFRGFRNFGGFGGGWRWPTSNWNWNHYRLLAYLNALQNNAANATPDELEAIRAAIVNLAQQVAMLQGQLGGGAPPPPAAPNYGGFAAPGYGGGYGG